MTILITIVLFIAVVAAAAYLVLTYNPVFGARSADERLAAVRRSPQYNGKEFVNPAHGASVSTSLGENLSTLRDFLRRDPARRPAKPLPIDRWAPLPEEQHDRTAVTWFGHSAVLLELEGRILWLDPMLGQAPSPFPSIGGKRYGGLPAEIADLPDIDAVVLSHDHYDHLDYGTILQLKDRVRHFIVPLGVGAHLERWGVEPGRIEEHDWWDEFEWEGLRFACTPAQHFSGRSLNDRGQTLWCSWVIQGERSRLFFSGDGGYSTHFAEIGRKYGPFDVTLMECGQYDRRWAPIHMTPEQTVQAHQDVQGGLLIPIHWGAFTLALHTWTDPVQRAAAAAAEHGVHIATPRIGEKVLLGSGSYPSSHWWINE
ncbi:MBL fold metallo-hydrolase [Paenibacillus sp. JX-17]|uniref:MBL fold metallo-hydrolase n=1 Tax=Paenibacillus lacisoli TaxID=3064525 RepID=A0ABT9CBS6_9BACL|nr:MBL fold metallo-hydrolase [Paenibacillus sp. JX-17]MDO7906325.1 MBL fold metallo-hydrolase [Paenibacillus sp. JX-17]